MAQPAVAQPLVRRALWLVGLTLVYNLAEAGVAVWAGLGAGSIALLGFGFDSVIECAASGFLLWRLYVEAAGADEEKVEAAERRTGRFVGATFLALTVYVLAESVWTLVSGDRPDGSLPGIVVAALSLAIMPVLAWAKLGTAKRLGSGALRAEAKETLACAYLSFALLVGLVLNFTVGWWWADPVAALAMVPWLVKEGIEGLRGEEE